MLNHGLCTEPLSFDPNKGAAPWIFRPTRINTCYVLAFTTMRAIMAYGITMIALEGKQRFRSQLNLYTTPLHPQFLHHCSTLAGLAPQGETDTFITMHKGVFARLWT